MNGLKRLFRFVVGTPGVVPNLLRKSDAAVIFMLHRFPDPALGNPAIHDVGRLRSLLGYLRRRKFDLVSVASMFERAEHGAPLNGAIAFTIDDGYRDHATVGAPLFAEFDCPVTTFVTSGFLDGDLWFWWDKIEFVFRHAQRDSVKIAIRASDAPMALEWHAPRERDMAQQTFTAACKAVPDDDKHRAIASLASALDVDLPTQAPSLYAPMSWSDARRCEQAGMTFGPHTVTHPILSRASDAQSKFEIEESWRRLASEVTRPVPVFCYPNGQTGDYTERETATIDRLGLKGAVIGSAGYATGDGIRERNERFDVPRFPMPDSQADLIQYVTGLERIKERLRAGRH